MNFVFLIALLRDKWTNSTLVDQLSDAMSILSTIGKGRGLVHTTEVAFQNYLIIHNILVVRWVLWKMNHICITMDRFLNARNKLVKPQFHDSIGTWVAGMCREEHFPTGQARMKICWVVSLL